MKSVVIAYEDHYCAELHVLIKRLRRDRGLGGMILESRTVQGTGGFVNEVPKLLRTALKQTKLPPELVVCLADADRSQNLVPDAPPAPTGADSADLKKWALGLEALWRGYLVEKSQLAADSRAKLRVVCLRWNKEKLLAASPEALLDYALRFAKQAQVQALLEQCEPNPIKLSDEDFVHRYRKPDACMSAVFQTIHDRNYKKGRDDEDLLRDQISPDDTRRARLLKRCPDLLRLLDAVG